MTDTVAVITFDPKNRTIKDLKTTQKFRFGCQRCASLCCKLGGPPLTRKDTEKIQKAGYVLNDFLEPKKTEGYPQSQGTLKTKENGACIFLQPDRDHKKFTCSIYDFRPALCRLYPFSIEKQDSNSVALKIIPCCMGLNSHEGKVLDKKFVVDSLLEPLFEAMKLLEDSPA